MATSRKIQYNIDDLFGTETLYDIEPAPAGNNNFSLGVSPQQLTDGEMLGNTIVKDGYLQSGNFVTTVTGWKLNSSGDFEANTGTFRGKLIAGEVHVPDQDTTASSFHVQPDGDTWWGATETNFNASNDNAIAYILKNGLAKFQSIILAGNVEISGIANNTGTDISLLTFSHDIVFSTTDADTVSWASGTITMSNGRTFSISAGNTGNMVTNTLIYLDTGVSSTVLQVTTSPSIAVGANKILLAIAENAVQSATFQVTGGRGGIAIDETQVFIPNLAAINADLGAITAGTITGGTIRTAASGTRFQMTSTTFQGINSAGVVIFEVIIDGVNEGDVILGDDATGDFAIWDNSAGTLEVFANNLPTFLTNSNKGDGSDGDLTTTGDVTLTKDTYYGTLNVSAGHTLFTDGYRMFVKGKLTVASTGKISNSGGNGGNATTTGGTAGTLANGNTLPAGSIGKVGADGIGANGVGTAGTAGDAVLLALGVAGSGGGDGGATTGFAGGVAGAGGARTSIAQDYPRNQSFALKLYDVSGTTIAQHTVSGGSGSGGSGGGANFSSGATGGGGGSGGSGGVLLIAAGEIENNGAIEAHGGNGGNGGNSTFVNHGGGGGGGGGGAGGMVILITNKYSGTGTKTATGGTAGALGLKTGNGVNGVAGTVGTDGVVIEIS